VIAAASALPLALSGSRVGFRRIARPAETLGEFRYLKSVPFTVSTIGRERSGLVRLPGLSKAP